MNNNTPIPANQEFSFKLEVGGDLNNLCTGNIHKAKVIDKDNTEIVIPSKSYFFVGDKFYVLYNGYHNDDYLNIPSEYQYIKAEHIQRTDYNDETKDFYRLVICNQDGKAYYLNYYKFKISLENILKTSEKIDLKEYYNIQETRGNGPLFKIVSETPDKNTETSSAILLDLHSGQEFGKLSSESFQYGYYSSRGHDGFELNYSDINKHQVNDDGSINLYNISHSLMQEEIENSPVFLIVQDGKYFFTDIQQEGSLVTNYNKATSILDAANFIIIKDKPNDDDDDDDDIDTHEKFIFRISKSNLYKENNENYASIILEDKEILLIAKDDNTDIFFYGNSYFEYCNNLNEVIKHGAPISGFVKPFFKIVQEKLDANNIYITMKSDEKNHIQIYLSDKQGNHILDLPNTELAEQLSTILASDYHQNEIQDTSTEHIAYKEESNTTQGHLKDENAISKNSIDKTPDTNTNEHNIPNPTIEQNVGTVYFPLSQKHINIGDAIGDGKHSISFDLTYEELLNFYQAVKENYSYDQVWSAYNNIFKNYGSEQQNSNIYIDANNHIFIDKYDFGLLQ